MSVRLPPPDPEATKTIRSDAVSRDQYSPKTGSLGGHKVTKGFDIGTKFASFIKFLKGALLPSLNRPTKPIAATPQPTVQTPKAETGVKTTNTHTETKKRPASEAFNEEEFNQFNIPDLVMKAAKAVKRSESEQSKAIEQLKEFLNNSAQEYETFGNYIVTHDNTGKLVDTGALIQKSKIANAAAAQELGISAEGWNNYQQQAAKLQSALRPQDTSKDSSLAQLQERYGGLNPAGIFKGIFPERFSVVNGVVMLHVPDLGRQVKMSDLFRDSGLTTEELKKYPQTLQFFQFCQRNGLNPSEVIKQ